MVAGLLASSTGGTLRTVVGLPHVRVLALIAATALGATVATCGSSAAETVSTAAPTFVADTGTVITRTTTEERTTTAPPRSTTVTTTKTAAALPGTVTNNTTRNNAAVVKVGQTAATTAASDQSAPAWAWVLIALAVVAIAVGIFFIGRGQRHRDAGGTPVADPPPQQGPPGPTVQ